MKRKRWMILPSSLVRFLVALALVFVLPAVSAGVEVGEKAPDAASGDQTFHLVERAFGRFARAIRLNGAFDLEHAQASLVDGEVTVVLPKLEERRGRTHRIPITAASSSGA